MMKLWMCQIFLEEFSSFHTPLIALNNNCCISHFLIMTFAFPHSPFSRNFYLSSFLLPKQPSCGKHSPLRLNFCHNFYQCLSSEFLKSRDGGWPMGKRLTSSLNIILGFRMKTFDIPAWYSDWRILQSARIVKVAYFWSLFHSDHT